MNSRRHSTLFLLTLMIFLALSAAPARAAIKILSVPGFPFFLTMDLGYGNEVRKLVLRTPNETRALEAFRGLIYVGENPLFSYTDRDWRSDLLWRVQFRMPARRGETPMGRDLWLGAITATGRLWVGSTETCPSLWDRELGQIETPDGTAFLVSPRLPVASPDSPWHPEKNLAFIYTIRLTCDGPRFVIVPPVYKRLAGVTDRVRKAETDPLLQTFYKGLFEDFTAMSQGHLPSVAALASFPWKNMGDGRMRP